MSRISARTRRRHAHHVIRTNTTAYIAVDTSLCKACWKCVAVCPRGVLAKINFLFHRHVRVSAPDRCTGCLACAKACPEGAIVPLKGQCPFKE